MPCLYGGITKFYKKMKSIIKAIIIAPLLVAGGAVVLSCDKTVTEPIKEAYIPTKLDENAGNWKPYILTSSSEVAVAAPKASSDASYLKELDSLKNKILPKITPTKKDAVAYWGAGAVYRWNEIGWFMRCINCGCRLGLSTWQITWTV
jgi:hypothetical protein